MQYNMSDWALREEDLLLLADNTPIGAKVLELGSGESTFQFDEMLMLGLIAELYSFEHIESIYEANRKKLQFKGNLSYAPLGPNNTYQLESFMPMPSSWKADLLLVDGPPGTIGRANAMAEAMQYVNSNGGLVAIDDINRPAELELYNALLRQGAITIANNGKLAIVQLDNAFIDERAMREQSKIQHQLVLRNGPKIAKELQLV